MGYLAFFAVATGGAIGTLLRWLLAILLNPLLPNLPLGTLAVNLIGGLIIGIALGYFTQFPSLPSELRLFVITGFCGGLTTFSAFSGETVLLLMRQQYGWAAAVISTHLIGSLSMTFLGFMLVKFLVRT